MTKTVSINQTVLDFLDYYTSAERKLDYAVLLDGPWGTGKTHLVRAFLEAHKARGGKHLYVSLYGMTSTNQIEDEFYRLLHPMLSSKGMRMAGTIIRGAAKGLLKIDFGGKSASESVTLAVPEINFADYLGGPGEHLLVFDDLERCAMPVSDLLGYINAFVEQDGMKVILIGNESEVIKGDKCFPLIKEKLIGQTLRVRSDVAAAYPDFLRQIAEGKVRGLLAAQREHVLTIHAQSKTNNLRLLKQSMWDFERLSKHISDEYWKNSKAILKLLQLTLAMSMEVRAGRIRSEHLPKLINAGFSRYIRRQQNEAPGPDEEFEQRYKDVPLADAVFRADVLGRIIIEGLTDAGLVETTLRESRYFAKPSDLPAWTRAWHGFSSEDAAYEAALAEVVRQFEAREEPNCAILYHMFGILLRASDIGALPKTRTEILTDGMTYVDEIARDERIVSSLEQSSEIDGSRSFAGLGYTEIQSSEFVEFKRYYSDAAKAAAVKSYGRIARAVLERLEEEPEEFVFDLSVSNARASPYYETPILAELPPDEFVAKLLLLPVARQITVFGMFKSRYESPTARQALAPELPWLAEVRGLLLEAMKIARPMTRYRITAMIKDDIDPFLIAEEPDVQKEASSGRKPVPD
jgi:hypothetical protein